MPELILYYFKSCPYCRKVMSYLEREGIKIELRDIHRNKEALEELIEIGGKNQVPCLFIDGEPLYESTDIIHWFENNF